MNAIHVTTDYLATVDEIRDVWAAVTQQPLASISGMAGKLSMARTKVYHILKFLEAAGYIRHNPRSQGRTVVIPLADYRQT